MSEKAICEGCDKMRVVRRIESGQLICNACYREIKPPRTGSLTSWSVLEEFASHGVELPVETTVEQSTKLYTGRGMLEYVIRDAWYKLIGKGIEYSGGSREELTKLSWELLKTGSFAIRMFENEKRKLDDAQTIYDDVRKNWEHAKRPSSERPGFYIFNGEMFDSMTGKRVTYWNYKASLERGPDFDRIHDLLYARYPSIIPRR